MSPYQDTGCMRQTESKKNQKPHIVQEVDNASGQNSGAFSSGGDKEDLEVNRDAEDEEGADPETQNQN